MPPQFKMAWSALSLHKIGTMRIYDNEMEFHNNWNIYYDSISGSSNAAQCRNQTNLT